MPSSLRSLWLSLKASYWFIPSLLTVFALMLALVTVHLDRTWGSAWLNSYGWFDGARPEGARAQLTVLASAMIAVSSTVFAITIAAVAYASGNYGPRLLTNFMNDRGNQLSLGVFIATFVYNLAVLRVVRNPERTRIPDQTGVDAVAGFVPQLSMLISSVSAVVAVGVLVYFLHHIPASIRIDTVLGGIGRRLVSDIEKRFPLEGRSVEPSDEVDGHAITATEIGYIKIIDFAQLDEIACKHQLRLGLRVRTGDFIHPHLPVVEVDGRRPDEAIAKHLLQCFSLAESRTPTQDLEFLIDELVEIALRALSPGINDPFTAVTSLHWMGAAMAKLADRELTAGPEQQDYDRRRVQPLPDDFAHFVQRSFGAVRASAAGSPIAAKIFIEALHGVWLGATSTRRRAVLMDEALRLVALADESLEGPSLAEVRERLGRFEDQARREPARSDSEERSAAG